MQQVFSTLKIPHQSTNPITVEVSRKLSKDLLGNNSNGFLTPLVTTSNATSNSRFFRSAYIPKKVDKIYFRFGIHGMTGTVRDDQKTFTPVSPVGSKAEEQATTAQTLFQFSTTKDTAGVVYSLIRYLLASGFEDPTSGVTFPTSSPTVFGNGTGSLTLNKEYFKNQISSGDPILALAFKQLSAEQQQTILNAINTLPSSFPLPTGGNISQVYAAVPQLEVGSLFGTELLLRFIPSIQLDKNVGDFSFFGVGLKHSISQYIEDSPLDIAIQGVYQTTKITQIVGVTKAELTADANIYNVNLEFSKKIKNISDWFGDLDIYGGYSFEQFNIESSYKYTLPVTLQKELGLMTDVNGEIAADPANGYPGDTQPQVAKGTIDDTNNKLILGIAKPIGPVTIALDYSISRFNLLTMGIDVTF